MEMEQITMGNHTATLSLDGPGALAAWLDTDNPHEAIMVGTRTSDWDIQWGDPHGNAFVLSFHAALDNRPPLFTDDWSEIERTARIMCGKVAAWAYEQDLPRYGTPEHDDAPQTSMYAEKVSASNG